MKDDLRIKNIMVYIALANKGQLFSYEDLMITALFYGKEDIETYFICVTLPDGDYYTTDVGLDRFIKNL